MSDREELLAALQELATAHGSSALAAAHQQLRRLAWKRRKKGKQEDGQLAKAVMEAFDIRDQLKKSGADTATINAGLERTLRDFWPKAKGRTEPWRYECDDCNDTGLLMMQCPGGEDPRCGRLRPHDAHEFGQPCFCKRGARFHDKPKSADDAVTSAAKVTKPTRFGR